MTCAGVSRTWQRICEDDQTWRQKCFENGYVEFDAPSFRFLGGWAVNPAHRANKQVGITICSHMDLQEAQQNRQAREIAYGQCFERSPWKSLYLRKRRIISNWRSRAIQSSTVLEDDFKYTISLQVRPGLIITGSHDYKWRVWNVEDAQPAFTLTGQNGLLYSYQVSEDRKYIVCSGLDGTVRVWYGQTGAQLHVLQGHTHRISCMSLHGTTLVSGSWDQTLRVWDIVDGKCLHILAVAAWVNFVKFDGERVVFDGQAFAVNVWNVHTEECLHMLTGHTERINSLLFEPERDLVVSGSHDGTIRVWDVQRGTCIANIVFHEGSRLSGYFEMQLRGNILACYYASEVKVWDIREGGSCLHHLHGVNGHTSAITSLQLLDSGLLVTGSMNGSVMLWDVDKGIFIRDLIPLVDHRHYYWNLEASETSLVCGVRVWEDRSGEETKIAYRIIAHLTPHDLMSCAGVSRTWQRICEDDQTWRQKCFENGYVEFDAPSFRFLGGWAVKRANEQAGICSHMDLQEAHQNRQAREIAYGQCYERSPWKSLYLRKKRIISNWRSRAIQSSTVLDDDLLYQVLYQKNQSARIITSFHDYKLRVWNAGDAQPAFTLSGQRGSGYSYQGSEDGKYIVSSEASFLTDLILCMSLHGTTLVSGSSDLTLRVWDIVDGKCLHILAIEAEAYFVKFDGKRVVFIGHGFTVNVWIIHTEECLHTLTGHTGPVDSLLFEPERGLVVSGSSDDGTIRVWDVQRGTSRKQFGLPLRFGRLGLGHS
ncbi:unnamed protein product, partial [Mesorhabditis belari]|uniref:F-box domain-containing protein n=1 Tax=Mesorhabditis belari TaxID=2138241 RepID=A0AAF3EYX4_9BILA